MAQRAVAVRALSCWGGQEGSGYGLSHARLFSLYRLWKDSSGTDLANASAHLSDSIHGWVHATVPSRDKVAPIGDQSRVSEPVIYDYHRHLMLEARFLSADPQARADAAWWLHHISSQTMESGFNFRHDLLPPGPDAGAPASLHYHAPGTGQLFARTGWDPGALWLDFSAGPYVQSHAHQDQGAFTLYQGDWLAVTENIWTHSGIQQGTDTHNVLRFERNGLVVPPAHRHRIQPRRDARRGRCGTGQTSRRPTPETWRWAPGSARSTSSPAACA
jgi:hypothetical protein